jgi:AraC-like DNA-binding protein/quercetin dioxygenase-like cupin family protein
VTSLPQSDESLLQTALEDGTADAVPGTVVALAFDLPAGFSVTRHRHRRCQLVFAARGVLTVTTEEGSWILPALRALWVPAGVEHGLRTTGEAQLRTLYAEPEALRRMPAECEVLEVGALFRELILRAVEVGPTLRTEAGCSGSSALVELLVEELERAQQSPLKVLHLPGGCDPRLRRLMARLRDNPGDQATLTQWGNRVGASARTLARLFAAETDLTFSRWRQQLRLQRALELLASGRSVSWVASEVGYMSLSAFIAMFRRATGRTPTAYLSRVPDR